MILKYSKPRAVSLLCYYSSCVLALTLTGVSELGVKLFRAKIGTDNTPSLRLFTDKLSFVEVLIITLTY